MKTDSQVAALPSAIGNQVERFICQHRRERLEMLKKQPAAWKEKLCKVNQKIMTIVWSKKVSAVANPAYVKRATRMVHGQLEFVQGSGKAYELIRVKFHPADIDTPEGPGTYWLSSSHYPAKQICCVNATAERNGFDLLREAYEGAEDQTFRTHSDPECCTYKISNINTK